MSEEMQQEFKKWSPGDKRKMMATLYFSLIPELKDVAYQCGYCLAIHGTLARDLDLLCVPWIEEASEPEELIAALKKACHGSCVIPPEEGNFGIKPHGRRAWNICFGGDSFLDISVMPKIKTVIS